MENTAIVIMLKDPATGFLDRELGSYPVGEFEKYVAGVHAEEIGGETIVKIRLTAARDVEDWEYDAIMDHYDEETLLSPLGVTEVEGAHDPTWEVSVLFDENADQMGEKLRELLARHEAELLDVYETIKDKAGEYMDE